LFVTFSVGGADKPDDWHGWPLRVCGKWIRRQRSAEQCDEKSRRRVASPSQRTPIAALCCFSNDRQEMLAPSLAPYGSQ